MFQSKTTEINQKELLPCVVVFWLKRKSENIPDLFAFVDLYTTHSYTNCKTICFVVRITIYLWYYYRYYLLFLYKVTHICSLNTGLSQSNQLVNHLAIAHCLATSTSSLYFSYSDFMFQFGSATNTYALG